mgnify:CR=1 FL=1
MRSHSSEYFLRRERVAGRLTRLRYAEEVDPLASSKEKRLGRVNRPLQDGCRSAPGTSRSAYGAAKRLCSLALALHIDLAALLDSSPRSISSSSWIDESLP